MRQWIGALALAAVACGGGGESGDTQQASSPAQAPAAQAAAPATGAVHEVLMVLRNGKYLYDPVTLTIKAGDRVRWVNVSGGPHNVQFYGDKIPTGAGDVLNAAMANRMGPLTGPFMMDSLATYEVSFANAPAGLYEYVCTPHEALGMKATLTVQQ